MVCRNGPSSRTSSSSSSKSVYTSERVKTRLVDVLTCSLGGGDETAVLSSTEDIANGDGLPEDMAKRNVLTNHPVLSVTLYLSPVRWLFLLIVVEVNTPMAFDVLGFFEAR